ncbi:COBRA-like protein 10 [Arachis stenosperma]|uniref:COBRA-like protein 10 n=1 Tax=Arachis stenosperma TaxID=217475 RepID=UPI0025ACEA87|nr:COBRA-like protein 10 [Arachis stenosperma]
MTISRFVLLLLLLLLLFVSFGSHLSEAQLLIQPGPKPEEVEAQGPNKTTTPPAAEGEAAFPPEADNCNGIFISYDLLGRRKEYPKLKNATAQPWAFNATATVLNTGTQVVKGWKLYVGFQHDEILVSASGAYLFEAADFPAYVGHGTYLVGAGLPDLQTAINTAQDLNQIQAVLNLAGTQFGVKPPAIPMPKTIKLVIDGYTCPQPTLKQSSMYACCKRDPKSKADTSNKKYQATQKGDLSIMYDVVQVYSNNYMAQVTMENRNPLGRLDRWNLTWEWTRGEFIYNIRGAFTREIDASDCVYGPAGEYYADMDFSKVMNCQKNPVISDLPPEKLGDNEIGNIPFCCRNGSILSPLMDKNQVKSVFMMQVFKIPPDLTKTSIYPPEKWKVSGVLNPDYKCSPPLKVEPSRSPDPRGIGATVIALASWQVVCNITTPTKRHNRCCVSFSAFYNDSAVPCNTCACGCPKPAGHCNPYARALLLPHEALLVPFYNRTRKSIAWAKLKHFPLPTKLPCPDNCGVSINWHILSDFKGGWTARITIFNWETFNFPDWFMALQFKNPSLSLQDVYSFNATFLPRLNHTIFMHGPPGLTYLVSLDNDTNPKVPGKQQSVISFSKKNTPHIKIAKGDGFPSRVYFNGEECSLPTQFPLRSANHHTPLVHLLNHILVLVLALTINSQILH